MPEAVQQKN